MGPNIYGFYYTWKNLCATFCTPYDVKGHAALSSQSGGIGMAIIGFSRSAKMGVSAIVGLGNKSDLDEDDLLDVLRAGRQHAHHRDALRGPEGRPLVCRGREARVEEEAGRDAEGGPHEPRRARRELAHGRARRQRQDLRRRAAPVGRHSRAGPARHARVRARDPGARRRRRARTSSSSPAPAARACCCRTPASTTS